MLEEERKAEESSQAQDIIDETEDLVEQPKEKSPNEGAPTEEPEEELSEEAEKKPVQEETPVEHQAERPTKKEEPGDDTPKIPLKQKIIDFYDTRYKILLIIPFTMLILSLILVTGKVISSGSFINKDVTLQGGVILTVFPDTAVDLVLLEKAIEADFPNNDISIRSIRTSGQRIAFSAAADIEATDPDQLKSFQASIEKYLDQPLEATDFAIEVVGSSLGESFFRETIEALLIAFLLMSIIVFLYFRTIVPSIAVILAAFSDIVVTLAIVNLMGIKLGTGGIAAFLMLIGYSVDTDMLLTTRLIKRKDGTVMERVIGAFKTGMMMNLTTMAAIIGSLFFVQSETIKQILTIVFIGLVVDIINTWIQNVGILRFYLERKNKNQNEA